MTSRYQVSRTFAFVLIIFFAYSLSHRGDMKNPLKGLERPVRVLTVHQESATICIPGRNSYSLRFMRSKSMKKRIVRFASLAPIVALALTNEGAWAPRGADGQTKQPGAVSKLEFEIIEGVFHDGLGTFAEVLLANELITLAGAKQSGFDLSRSKAKMFDAINRLSEDDPRRERFNREIVNIQCGVKSGAPQLLAAIKPSRVARVRHTPREYADAHAGDLVVDLDQGGSIPISVKTDKSHKVAVAEGQTPDIGAKWANRYFRVTDAELAGIIKGLGFSSIDQLKSEYLNVARLVAEILISKLGLKDCAASDFRNARITDLEAVKYLFRQLRFFKSGKDRSRVIIFDRGTGSVKWESLLDELDVEGLKTERVTMLPSRPRRGHPIASEFGIKVDGRTVVTFQVKHKRGRNRGTVHRLEFSDITTRLTI